MYFASLSRLEVATKALKHEKEEEICWYKVGPALVSRKASKGHWGAASHRVGYRVVSIPK